MTSFSKNKMRRLFNYFLDYYEIISQLHFLETKKIINFCLIGLFILMSTYSIYAGCGIEVNIVHPHCIDLWSDYVRGTSAPCAGESGACVLLSCGPVILQ